MAHSATLMIANVADVVTLQPDPAEIACLLAVARVNGVFAVNMSFAIPPSTAVTDQIRAGYNQNGMVFVAMAGNTYGGAVTYPATLSEVIAVTATNSSDVRASFAAIGPEIDLAAPGENILSTSLPTGSVCTQGGLTGTCSGTSMAAPHVAAAAVLLKARYPSWSNVAIISRLLVTAKDLGPAGFDNSYGYGRLDVLAALQMSVGIQGPAFAFAGSVETWTAEVIGGLAPYSYQWYVDGLSVGTGQSLVYQAGGADFELRIDVTAAQSQQATSSMTVRVSNCTPPQIIC